MNTHAHIRARTTARTTARRSAAVATSLAAVLALGLSAPAGAAERSGDRGPGPMAAAKVVNDLARFTSRPVRGTWTDPATGRSGTSVARFVPTGFVDQGGTLAVTGTVRGVLGGRLPDGTPRRFAEDVVLPVSGGGAAASAAASSTVAAVLPTAAACDVLSLDLGPLALDVLGLQVDLSRVVLDVVAQPGAGNLLGNLLCAVAGLLDGGGGLGGLLDGVVDLLNGLLGGVLALDGLLGALDGLLGGVGGAAAGTATRSV